jgi:hypothetical protein
MAARAHFRTEKSNPHTSTTRSRRRSAGEKRDTGRAGVETDKNFRDL